MTSQILSRPNRSVIRHSYAVGFSLAFAAITSTADCQQVPNAATELLPAEQLEVRVFELAHRSAADAGEILYGVFPDQNDLRFVVGGEMRLIVAAKSGMLDRVTEVLEVLDQPEQERADPRTVKIMRLSNTEARAAGDLIVQLVPSVEIAVDERTNSLILSTEDESQALTVEAILMKLDAAEPESVDRSTTTYQIDLFWMVESSGEDTGEDEPTGLTPDPRLKGVVAELTEQGFQHLQLWGQARVAAKSEAKFRLTSSNTIGYVDASGTLLDANDGQVVVSLNMNVFPHASDKRHAQGELDTEIVTKLDHNVVLGIAGATGDDRRSAFVVRVERE